MLTIDDRRAREALVATYAQFQVPDRFCKNNYQLNQANCLMGGISRHLGLVPGGPCGGHALYDAIQRWFIAKLGRSPEELNDEKGRVAVLTFLEERIADLDRELLEETTPVDPMPMDPAPMDATPELVLGNVA